MRINRGTGNRAKKVTDSKILRINWRKPDAPPHNKNTPTILINMKEKATGIPASIRITKLPKIISRTSHHSKDAYLLISI